MRSTTHSTCPIVRRETMALFENVNVGGAYKLVGFEKEIIWVRESEAAIVLRHRGKDVDTCGTLNDFYGFLTSLEGAIQEDTPSIAKRLSIDATTELCVCVDLKIEDLPLLEDDSEAGWEWNKRGRRKQYQTVGDRWFTSSIPVANYPDDKYPSLPRLQPIVVTDEKNIYSTRSAPIGEIPENVKKFIADARAAAENIAPASARQGGMGGEG